jgi:hypothetical protein
MSDATKDGLHGLKLAVSLGALTILLVRILFPALRIDAVSLGLIAVALLPWLSPLIKSAKLPGGFEIEFQDVKDAAEKVTSGEASISISPPSALQLSYLEVAEQDPNLALVALRIEIEKRVRHIAELAGVPRSRSLTVVIMDLQVREILNPDSVAGLRDLITLGNQAAHGVPVAPQAANSVEYGPRVLSFLDSKIVQLGGTA